MKNPLNLKPGDMLKRLPFPSKYYSPREIYAWAQLTRAGKGHSIFCNVDDIITIIAIVRNPWITADEVYIVHHRSGARGYVTASLLTENGWLLIE